MSLVNLSHVCSHLQNASLARLGLTSIPYTRLHLSLALLLQKQGFLSQVKLAGPSPPASCFPPGVRENQRITSHPYTDRRHFTPERALQRMVENSVNEEELREEGFGDEAVEYAMTKRQKTIAQLERDGWDNVVVDFLFKHRNKELPQLEEDGLDGTSISIIQSHATLLHDTEAELVQWRINRPVSNDELRPYLLREEFSDAILQHLAGPDQQVELDREYWDRVAVAFLLKHRNKTPSQLQREELDSNSISILESYAGRISECEDEYKRWRDAQPITNDELRSALLRAGFSVQTLQHFAGPNRFISPRELLLDGLPLQTMGLEIPNQPFQPPPPPSASDPWDLETEGVVTQANRASRRLWLGLKYWDGLPVLSKAKMLSKPTKRIWLGERDLQKLVTGRDAGQIRPLTKVGELMAISTDRGVMEVRECVERRIGGMVLCRVW